MIISTHKNYYLNYNSFLLCKNRNVHNSAAFGQPVNGIQPNRMHSHKKHMCIQNTNSSGMMLCMRNDDKLKESKKLIRVIFHIRNSCYKNQKTEPLMLSFPSSQFKQTRITIGEIVNKIVSSVATQLCEGDGNLFAEQFFYNIIDNQQQHQQQQKQPKKQTQNQFEQSFSSQFMNSQLKQQNIMKSISSQSPQMCYSYNQNTCKLPCTSSQKQLLFKPSLITSCQYCIDPFKSPNMLSSHEDVIRLISKRIVITSMSFPNSKTLSNVDINRQNLNNIIQLQDMQHVSVNMLPLPACFRQCVTSSCLRDQFTAVASEGFVCSQNGLLDSKNAAFSEENEKMNQQFYEELPSFHRAESQTIQEDDLMNDFFRRSGEQQQYQNPQLFSTRSSSNFDNKNKECNSHFNISSSNPQARLFRNEDESQENDRLHSTNASLVFNGEDFSVRGEEIIETCQDANENPNKKQKQQGLKQSLVGLEGFLQKRVKLNLDPIQNTNHSKHISYNTQKIEDSNILQQQKQNKSNTSKQTANKNLFSSTLINSNESISYEQFASELMNINSSSSNNKFNQQKDQQEQLISQKQLQPKQILIQQEKTIIDEEWKNKSLKFQSKLNNKSNNLSFFQNFNFNQDFIESPSFLGSDSELMKTTLKQIELPNTYNHQKSLNFNYKNPQLKENQSQQDHNSPILADIYSKDTSSIPQIDQLKHELRAQLLPNTCNENNRKAKYLKRLFMSNKEIRKNRRSKLNEKNIELIMKLDHELQLRDKLKNSESNQSNNNFEDQSTHTCSLPSANNTPQKLSPYLKEQIQINRVLRFLDDSLFTQTEDLQQYFKKNKEEIEQLCQIIYTYTKADKYSSKPFQTILDDATQQINSRFFLSKDEVKQYFFDLQNIFPNWINIEDTNYGQCCKINPQFKYKQVKNFFRQQSIE